MGNFRKAVKRIPKSKWGKQAFIIKLKHNARVLDVGCGNNSAYYHKMLSPANRYVGIDIADYNIDNKSKEVMEEYHIIKDPEEFANGIKNIDGDFDAIVSSHNIEHCNKPIATLEAICSKVRKNGLLYLSFPQERTTEFPSRGGTLNFYDDPTHIYMPDHKEILGILKKNGMEILFDKVGYKPFYYWVIGGVLEPISRLKNQILPGTYSFWGFETVIWARKVK